MNVFFKAVGLIRLQKLSVANLMNPKDALRCGVAVASTIGSVFPVALAIVESGMSGSPSFDWYVLVATYGIALILSSVTLLVLAQFLPGLVVAITHRIRRRYPLAMAMIGCFLGFVGGGILFLTVRFLFLSHSHWNDPQLWKCFMGLTVLGAIYGMLMALATAVYLAWQGPIHRPPSQLPKPESD